MCSHGLGLQIWRLNAVLANIEVPYDLIVWSRIASVSGLSNVLLEGRTRQT